MTTVTVSGNVLLLVAWVASGLYVPVIVSVRAVVPVGAYVTEHEALVPVPDNVHGEVVNVPVPLVVKLTVPVGRVAPVVAVSATVAVQVVEAPTFTLEGVHETVVVVGFAAGRAMML